MCPIRADEHPLTTGLAGAPPPPLPFGPAPAPAAPASGGTETIDSLAGKIKSQYPVYQAIDNQTLVHSVTQKYPVYQTKLKDEELQKLAGGPPKNYGFTAGNMAGQAWQGAKELAGGLYTMGKDVLFPPGATEAEK